MMYPQEFFIPTNSSHPPLPCQMTLLLDFARKADRTWHYSYHDFTDKNRKVGIILCPSYKIDICNLSCPIYLMHLSM